MRRKSEKNITSFAYLSNRKHDTQDEKSILDIVTREADANHLFLFLFLSRVLAMDPRYSRRNNVAHDDAWLQLWARSRRVTPEEHPGLETGNFVGRPQKVPPWDSSRLTSSPAIRFYWKLWTCASSKKHISHLEQWPYDEAGVMRMRVARFSRVKEKLFGLVKHVTNPGTRLRAAKSWSPVYFENVPSGSAFPIDWQYVSRCRNTIIRNRCGKLQGGTTAMLWSGEVNILWSCGRSNKS